MNAVRSQREREFGWQNPLVRGCVANAVRSSVTRRVARPKRFPCATERWRQQRLRSRIDNLAFSKIDEQEPIICLFRKISQEQTIGAEHRSVDSAGTLQPKPRIFPAQFEKIDMQIVQLAIVFAL